MTEDRFWILLWLDPQSHSVDCYILIYYYILSLEMREFKFFIVVLLFGIVDFSFLSLERNKPGLRESRDVTPWEEKQESIPWHLSLPQYVSPDSISSQ